MKQKTIYLLLLIFSLLFLGQSLFAQSTLFYQCKKKVAENGVIQKDERTSYFTFSGDSAYESDRDGNLLTINHITGLKATVYKYCKTVDGNRYYYVWGPIWRNGYMTNGFWENQALVVSSDYSVLNVTFGAMFGLEGYTLVYYRASESEAPQKQVPGLIR